MKKLGLAKLVLGGVAVLAVAGMANAGGFSRGTADTDILYEPGNFNMRAGVTIVNPSRKFSSHVDPGLVGKNYTDMYAVPSVALKFGFFDPLACAGTYVQAYGGDVNYEGRLTPGKLKEEFTVDEFGVTCSVKFNVGKGNLHLIGGGFVEQFNYDRTNFFSPLLPNGTLELSGSDGGYRIGVGYEIPEIALRAQLMYRSGTSYGASGTLSLPGPLVGAPPGVMVPIDAVGEGNLPQSVKFDFQTGIAPGWLALASIKWTDWSVQEALVVRNAANGSIISLDPYNWKDGWTITAGVGHAFNDRVSGLVAVTWDQGVSTGYDHSSDTWTLSTGASVKDNLGGEFRAGLGLSYLTSKSAPLAPEPSSVDSGWAFAVNGGYKFTW
ncbi:outer membrane protein transport protein [Aquamicrobium sp. LC103]|uniref:OmpP1/FadL family transporter n=1 Tax=Aquamicrobium sp. LC103 TaxID=1120658 RepID=UPI00063E7395|nr:outer membrane protein transport protein [Aquamicrobium sp. LC103]TKT76753.1 aromatic hydrocarbon degradation protein [Aquamicrobium sp. LC103]